MSAVTDKPLANLQAQCALAGFSLHELADGSFIVSKWNLVKPLPDLQAVRTFLRQFGAPGL